MSYSTAKGSGDSEPFSMSYEADDYSMQRQQWLWGAFLMAAILFAAVAGCGGASSSPDRATLLPELPDLSAAYPEVAEAVRSRFKIVRKHSDSAGAWGRYGMTLDAHEFREQCAVCYRMASRLDPTDVRWRYYLAVQLRTSDPDQALGILELPFAVRKSNVPVLLLKAALLQEKGQIRDAEQTLRLALEADESSPAVVVGLARLLLERKDPAAAKALLLTLPGPPGSAPVAFQETAALMGKIEAASGNTGLAEKLILESTQLPSVQTSIDDEFLRELAAFRRDPLWTGQLAVTRARQGDALAVLQLRELVERYPELAPNRIHLAGLLMDEGQLDEAKDLLLRGLGADGRDSRLLTGLAAVCLEQEDWTSAEEYLRTLLSEDSASVSANSDLAFVLEQQRRPAEAIKAYRKAIQLAPASQQLRERLEALEKADR